MGKGLMVPFTATGLLIAYAVTRVPCNEAGERVH